MVSTPDFQSSDPSSNLGRTYFRKKNFNAQTDLCREHTDKIGGLGSIVVNRQRFHSFDSGFESHQNPSNFDMARSREKSEVMADCVT